MDCPYCGTANPAQARFCLGCGRPLVTGTVCAACHTWLPAHARFCFHCGAMVAAPMACCPQCGAAVAAGQVRCLACGTDLAAPAAVPLPLTPAPAIAVPAPSVAPPAPLPPATRAAATSPTLGAIPGRLPPPRSLQAMLPSLRRYLPDAVYEPLERRPTTADLGAACARLASVIRTVKTYLPGPVVMAPQPAGVPVGGLYQGTFLFVDVSGFTSLAERLSRLGQLGAERITGIINNLFNDLIPILHDHGGTLLKFGGDALLGLFGESVFSLPVKGCRSESVAEGALRAVQAALAMQSIMDCFAAIDAGGQTRALCIKCGISSGPFFAAHLGTEHRMAYITTGHTVNRADQAEGHATPGDVVITQSTYELIGAGLEVETRDEGFYQVLSAPRLEQAVPQCLVDEPPVGELDAQITYLVDRLDRLTLYLAGDLLSRIVTSPDPEKVYIAPEHRPVAVMFANYVGVSELVEDMGATRPEAVTAHLNDYFVHMARIVERYDGTLAHMDQYSVGDRLVVFWGAPRAHEDDPVRAVHTAVEMQAATRRHFAALQLPEGIYRFRQRIGINAGSLFAGNVGASDRRQEYTLMGDDINVAARLMSRAEWGDILISGKTEERVRAHFELEHRGQFKVKGKEILIPTFRVLAGRQQVSHTWGLAAGESPLADREDELATLKRCGEALRNGRGQIVSIIGSSGLGKSRLMRELRHWLFGQEAAAEIRWLEGSALSFSEQVGYWLAAQVLHRATGVKPEATADERLYALWEQCETLLGKATAREVTPFLAHILDLPLTGDWERWVADLEPHVRQKQTFWAMREYCAASARQQPLVIAIDDLHWADEASLALLEDLLQVTDRAPFMLCLVFRERRDKGCWRLRDRAEGGFPHRYTEVALKPLSDAYGRTLLGQLLPGATLQAETVQAILDKSAGNPFYLEEVVRSLIDSEAVVPDDVRPGSWRVAAGIDHIAVPDSLQGAILARIDRLTEDARQALQMAAVIGRRFQLGALRGLAGAEAEMELWLSQLERTGLIQPISLAADPVYSFPDALVQEVAYESLLVQRRRDFHRRIGEALEATLADQADQECERLAYHLSRCGDHPRAAHYLELAAHKAQASFANETALHYYSDLLALVEADWQKQFDVLARRQQVYRLVGAQKERQADLETMLALAEEHGDRTRRADTFNALADFFQWTGNYCEAEREAAEALAVHVELGNQAGQSEAVHQLGVVHYVRGDYAHAQPELEQAVALREVCNNPAGEAMSLMYLGMVHFMQSSYSQAARLHDQALSVALARQDWEQEGIHRTNAARVLLRLGEYDRAVEQLDLSLEKKRRVGDRTGQGFSLFCIGLVRVYQGRYDEAQQVMDQSLAMRQQIGDSRGIGYCLYGQGLIALGRGEYEQAAGFFQESFELRSRLGLKAEVILDLSHLGLAQLGAGRLDQASAASARAVALLATQKHVEETQQVYLNHYRVLSACGDPAAGQFLDQAYQVMMGVAGRIEDAAQRQVFLDQVRVNRDIAIAMAHMGAAAGA